MKLYSRTVIRIEKDNVAIPTATFQAKKLARNGKFVKLIDSEKSLSVKEWWRWVLEDSRPDVPMSGPITIHAQLRWKAPANQSTKRRIAQSPDGEPKVSKPDLDNLCKAMLDTMVQLGYMNDDGQVYSLNLQKYNDWEKGGLVIVIHELGIGEKTKEDTK